MKSQMNLEEIWSLYRKSLAAFLHSKVSNSSDVDDLLQEILFKTYNNIGSIQKEESIRSWLYQVANRTIIDFYRKKEQTSKLNNEPLWYENASQDVKQELSKCIEPFLAALPEAHADLLRSIDLDGKSQKEYAEELGISYSTLKSRVQKSRDELKKLFEKCCEFKINKHGRLIGFETKSDSCKNC